MKKRISLHWLRLLVLFAFPLHLVAQQLPENQLQLPAGRLSTPFYWLADTLGWHFEPHAAILLPVTIAGQTDTFYMQFDLGAPSTVLYRQLLEKSTSGLSFGDSTVTGFTFHLGGKNIRTGTLALKDYAANPSSRIIGTLGADLMDNRVAVIDYPGQQLILSDKMPANENLVLSGFHYAGRSILFPAVVAGIKTLLFFDTGSSAFELLTGKKQFEELSIPNAQIKSYPVRSWNRMLMAHNAPAHDSVQIGGQTIPLRTVTHIEGASEAQVSRMMQLGIGGMTGNKLFVGYQLLLNTSTKQFVLLPPTTILRW